MTDTPPTAPQKKSNVGVVVLAVSAQNQGETGNLKCEVLLNGTVTYTSNASGAYAICTASGRA